MRSHIERLQGLLRVFFFLIKIICSHDDVGGSSASARVAVLLAGSPSAHDDGSASYYRREATLPVVLWCEGIRSGSEEGTRGQRSGRWVVGV